MNILCKLGLHKYDPTGISYHVGRKGRLESNGTFTIISEIYYIEYRCVRCGKIINGFSE